MVEIGPAGLFHVIDSSPAYFPRWRKGQALTMLASPIRSADPEQEGPEKEPM